MAKDTAGDSDSRASGALLAGSRWILGTKSSASRTGPARSARTTRRSGRRSDPVPSRRTLDRVRAEVAPLSDIAVQRLNRELPWFGQLRAKDRADLALLAQQGISTFLSWFDDPDDDQLLLRLFRQAPGSLTSELSLHQALQVLREVGDVVEERVSELSTGGDEGALRDGVLRFSRDVAFAAADIYARSAEHQDAWSARAEAAVVDGLLSGQGDDTLRSQAAALGWTSTGPVTAVVGASPEPPSPAAAGRIRRAVSRCCDDVLISFQGDRLMLLLADLDHGQDALSELAGLFGPGPVVYGPQTAGLLSAASSAGPASAALAVAHSWPGAPRPVHSEELWPERLLTGEETAARAIVEHICTPLATSSTGLEETLATYIAVGHSLEATSRELHVHANTVRYRLRRVFDLTGWDPLVARDAFVLHCALVVGRLRAGAETARAEEETAPVERRRG